MLKVCAICDVLYNKDDAKQRNAHIHPEPQRGAFRADFLKSRLTYEQWVSNTRAGQMWALRSIT
jgi:hypothetical protein